MIAAPLLLSGCGGSDGPPRYAVSGTITLDGQPLDNGSISFGSEGEGMSGGATIEDGEYYLPKARGLWEGKYRVRITSVDSEELVEEAPGDSSLVESTERIPAAYNVNSEETVEVTPDGDNEFNYDIKSQ